MVSILLGVWNGGGVCCCCPARCSGVARALLIPVQCWRVLLSCRALFFARCVVCGWASVSVCCSCGGVSSVRSSLTVVEGGAIVDGGVCVVVVGGMVSEGRPCCWLPRLVCGVPRLCVGVPLVVYPVALLNGGCGVCCIVPLVLCCPRPLYSVPCLWIRSGILYCLVLFVLHSLVSCYPLLLCVAVLLCGEREGGVCGVGVGSRHLSSSPSPSPSSSSSLCWCSG